MPDNKLATVEAAPLAKEPDSFVAFLERASKDPNFSVEKFQVIMAAKERAEEQERERLYAVDMIGLQSDVGPMVKAGENKYTGSKYVRLDDELVVLQPLFQKWGFAPGYDSKPVASGIEFSCTMTHRAGHSKTKTLTLPVDGTGSAGGKSNMNDVQKVGSTTTYARRYLLDMHLNIARKGQDDDGAGVVQYVTETQARQIADALAKYAEAGSDPGRFWRFMSIGMPVPIDTVERVLERDYRRAMGFFQVTK